MVVIPKWSLTVSHMLATEGAEVWINCTGCNWRKPIDLRRLVMQRNPLFCLWDRRPICKTCGRKLLINGHHAAGAIVLPLITHGEDRGVVARLHSEWAWLKTQRTYR